jgi:hypothetical protein
LDVLALEDDEADPSMAQDGRSRVSTKGLLREVRKERRTR